MDNVQSANFEKPIECFVCPVHACKNNGAVNLYTCHSIKTNELEKIKNIFFLIEDFSFCFVYRELQVCFRRVLVLQTGQL